MSSKANIEVVLGAALDLQGGGIQPKVKMALRLLVEHVGELERERDRLLHRVAALEKIAHSPDVRAVSTRAIGGKDLHATQRMNSESAR